MAALRLILVFLAIHQVLIDGQSRPKGAVIIFRHGDRTPIKPYKNDPHKNESSWSDPWGQLTKTGMSQMYGLGQRLRIKYGHLLKDVFDTTEINVKSTDVDRTIMSAQASLAGLYPIKTPDMFTPETPWRPTPVHTIPVPSDNLIGMWKDCPKFAKLLEDLMAGDHFKQLKTQYKPIVDQAELHTGEKFPPNFFREITTLLDTLMIQKAKGKALPEWANETFIEQLEEISNITFTIETFTPEMARLNVGPLFKKLTDNLIAIDTNKVTTKVFMYSAHDTNVANFLNAMNLKKYEQPPYASALMFDLMPGAPESTIQVTYLNETLSVPDCGDTCALSRWKLVYHNLLIDNRDQECQLARRGK